MPLQYFPQNSPQRVRADPKLFRESARVVFSREPIPIFTGVSSATDDQGYYPISAIYFDVSGCRPAGLCADEVVLFLDDAMARCTVYVNAFYLAQAAVPSLPVTVDFRLKMAAGSVSSTVWEDSVTLEFTGLELSVPPDKGILAVGSGVGATQYEIWARVMPSEDTDVADLEVRLQMVGQRRAGQIAAWSGPLCNGGGLLPPP